MTLAPKLAAHRAEIPAIGFGTSGMGDVRAEHIVTALKAGYRHIDTARKYGTERVVGEGIRASGVPRPEISCAPRCRTKICIPPISPARSMTA